MSWSALAFVIVFSIAAVGVFFLCFLFGVMIPVHPCSKSLGSTDAKARTIPFMGRAQLAFLTPSLCALCSWYWHLLTTYSSQLYCIFYILLALFSPPPITYSLEEGFFVSTRGQEKPLPLPSLNDIASLDLSVVIPAYNEALRLPPMLRATLQHLLSSDTPPRSFEIIIVDDGSTDGTTKSALSFHVPPRRNPKSELQADLRVVKLSRNKGKGAAVKHGMLHSRGKRILMVDADGASRFEDLELLWEEMDNIEADGQAIVVGSRAHLVGTDAVVKVSTLTVILNSLRLTDLHAIAFIHTKSFDAWTPFLFKNPRCWIRPGYTMRLQGRNVVLCVCGLLLNVSLQLFSRESARSLFPTMHISHWIFDVELLLLARILNIPVAEVAIAWHEVEGSKINLVTDSIGMLRDLIVLRANYAIGRWTIQRRQKQD